MEEGECKGMRGRIRKLFGFFEDVYFRFTHFKELSESYKNESDRANELYSENERLAKEIGHLKERDLDLEGALSGIENEKAHLCDKIAELERGMDNYETKPKYLELLEAKSKAEKEREGYKTELKAKMGLYEQQINEQRAEYEKRIREDRIEIDNDREKIDELGRLIGHLKRDKKEIIEFADYIIREKSAEPLINLLKDSKIPYVLLDPRTQKIIDYNPSFAAELGINGDLRNESYLSILDGRENKENLRIGLRKFLDTDEKKEFDVYYEKGGKKISLHITKQKPIVINIDLTLLGKKNKEARIVTCIPLVVEKASTWQKYHAHSLEQVMAKTEEEIRLKEEVKREMPAVTCKLVEYGWEASGKRRTSDKIVEIIDKMGETGAYLYFKSIVSGLDAATEKKKQEEEEKRKTQRKKEARARLKRLKRNPKRISNTLARLSKRGIEENKLMEIARNTNLNYKEVRMKCSELLREYRASQNGLRQEL